MTSLWWAIAIGFFLGLRHAADPDHVVAMSTIVSRSKRFGVSWFLGVCWGMGHTVTVFSAGAAIVLLRLAVRPHWEASLEFAVGVMLVVLGALNLRGVRFLPGGVRKHSHEHTHGAEEHHHHLFRGDSGASHDHPHPHSDALADLSAAVEKGRALRSFGVGLIHGLAGSSALALMVLAAIPDPRRALAYLAVFGLGTLVGMMALSTVMELAMIWTLRRWRFDRALVSGAGAMSLALGAYIMYHNALEIFG